MEFHPKLIGEFLFKSARFQPSMSPTFYERNFCTKFLAPKFQTQKPALYEILAPKTYKKCACKMLMILTLGQLLFMFLKLLGFLWFQTI
jgi:hypothetical protein